MGIKASGTQRSATPTNEELTLVTGVGLLGVFRSETPVQPSGSWSLEFAAKLGTVPPRFGDLWVHPNPPHQHTELRGELRADGTSPQVRRSALAGRTLQGKSGC